LKRLFFSVFLRIGQDDLFPPLRRSSLDFFIPGEAMRRDEACRKKGFVDRQMVALGEA
jgi:hypothetical protein